MSASTSSRTAFQSLEQRRAQHAWKCVDEMSRKDTNVQRKYHSEAKKFPMRVRTAGLGQTLAFLWGKTKGGEKEPGIGALLEDLNQWIYVVRPENDGEVADNEKRTKLLQDVIEGTATASRRHAQETLSWITWVIRFAAGQLADSETDEPAAEDNASASASAESQEADTSVQAAAAERSAESEGE